MSDGSLSVPVDALSASLMTTKIDFTFIFDDDYDRHWLFGSYSTHTALGMGSIL